LFERIDQKLNHDSLYQDRQNKEQLEWEFGSKVGEGEQDREKEKEKKKEGEQEEKEEERINCPSRAIGLTSISKTVIGFNKEIA
jgi:hypothetical protein